MEAALPPSAALGNVAAEDKPLTAKPRDSGHPNLPAESYFKFLDTSADYGSH
jgi:hypothetical protein